MFSEINIKVHIILSFHVYVIIYRYEIYSESVLRDHCHLEWQPVCLEGSLVSGRKSYISIQLTFCKKPPVLRDYFYGQCGLKSLKEGFTITLHKQHLYKELGVLTVYRQCRHKYNIATYICTKSSRPLIIPSAERFGFSSRKILRNWLLVLKWGKLWWEGASHAFTIHVPGVTTICPSSVEGVL